MMKLYRVLVAIILTTPGYQINAQITQRNIDSLLLVLASSKPDTHKVKTMNSLSQNYRIAGDNAKSKLYADSAIVLSTDLHFLNGKAMGYILLGVIDFNKGNYTVAHQYYSTALTTYKQATNNSGVANAMSLMANIHNRQGNRSAALEMHKEALEVAKTSGESRVLITIYNNIGSIYGAQGDYPKALIYFLDGLKVAREHKDKSSEATLLQNIGAVYEYQGNYKESKAYRIEHMQLMEEVGNKRGIAGAYHSLAISAQREKLLDEGIGYLQKASLLYQELDNKPELAQVLHDLGSLYRQKKMYPEAIHNYQLAIQIREELQLKAAIGESKITLGTIIAEMAAQLPPEEANARYAEGISYIEQGMILAKEAGEIETVRGAYNALTEIYEATGDYKNALIQNRKFQSLSDSLLNNETKQQIEKQRTAFEVEKAKAEEKVLQDRLLAEQQFANEQDILKRNNQHALAIANEKAEQERLLVEQQCETDKLLADENAQHQLVLAEEKAKQEKKEAAAKAKAEAELADRKKITGMILTGVGLLSLLSLFFILYQRQRNLKRKAIEKAETIHKMTELELQSLRAQLNPHFMFNSLNAIQELILMEENDKSHTYLARFAKLLRMLLENANNPLIPLARELEFLQLYLSLENLRIPDLRYSIYVAPDIQTEQTKIPNMILQPYIENAIWHGLSPKEGEKILRINIARQNGTILYEIVDNGVGRKKAAEMKSMYRKEHKSRGMELLSKRFKLLNTEYGSEINTTITDVMTENITSGTKVSIRVPSSLQEKIEKQYLN